MQRQLTLIMGLIIALASILTFTPAFANEGDLIWDAFNSQNGIDMKAKYKESPENGMLEQTLEVEVQDIPANTTVSISINGRKVGEMTSDATGLATFRLFKLVAPGPDGRPTGARVETGDIIRVYRGGQGIEAPFVPRP